MMCGFDKEAAFATRGNVYTPAAINSTHGRKSEHDSSRMGTLQGGKGDILRSQF